MRIDPQRIRDAQSLLARHFGPTRIARAASLSSPGHDVYLKIETELPTGSFKVRGAIYALVKRIERDGLKAVPYVRAHTPESLVAGTPAGVAGPPVGVAGTPVGVARTLVGDGRTLVGDGLQAVPEIR